MFWLQGESFKGRSVATCTSKPVTEKSEGVYGELWRFGYFKVQPSLSEMLRVAQRGSLRGSTATADGFHCLEHFASRVPEQASVRHPRERHVRVSAAEQWPWLLGPQRFARILSPTMGMKFSWASKCRKIDRKGRQDVHVLSRRVTRDRLGWRERGKMSAHPLEGR